MFGIVESGAYDFTAFLLINYHVTRQHPGDAVKAVFFNLGELCGLIIALLTI